MMNRGGPVRVLVVDDSAFMRKIIGDILAAEPRIEIVGRARNGKEALASLEELRPDVITLDMEMPGMNGLETLREIMSRRPTPVVVVSSLAKDGAEVTMQALAAGAVDFVTKPSGTVSLDMEKVGEELRETVLGASRALLRNVSPAPLPPSPTRAGGAPQSRREAARRPELLVVAASTGGPMALQEVIPMLPAAFPFPIMVVQHMPPGFTTSFAHRLDERSALHVVEAEQGMPVRSGTAYIAPGGFHLCVERAAGKELVCRLSDAPPVRSVRPAADVLFSSAADAVGGAVVALILTGMGKDGLDGTKRLREKGAYVIAESKETCVIYGMPGAVVEAGLADEILPLPAIAKALERIGAHQRGAE